MYTNFFSLSELPFSIAPNPKYLFMSDRHREALTHLSNGLGGADSSDNGGFVLLTGEVGTGKTTVSRCLMDNLPEGTQLAFILNPTLSSQELLATICDQLKIRYRKTGATLKTLTDKISEKLLKNHAKSINTILIIDEAQHLEAQVLEQLRLLTNLETNTKKLLQVILIGQPELQQLLKRRDLRQLAQRITARYHLLPLNQQELAEYIKHRLSIADCHRALFDKSALAAIHKLSQGVPRLINLLCHSALMEAYNSNNAVINKTIVMKAASHALGDDLEHEKWWQNRSIQIAVAASFVLLVLNTGFFIGQKQSSKGVINEKVPQKNVTLNTESEETLAIEKPEVELAETAKELAKEIVKEVTIELEKEKKRQEQTIEQMVIHSEAQEKTHDLIIKPPKTHIKKPIKKAATEVSKESLTNQPDKPLNYQVEPVAGVSDDLLARFQAAVEDTENENSLGEVKPEKIVVDSDIKSLTQMPTWLQEDIPSLYFEQHIYASDGAGWVNVNGRDRYEGDSIANGLVIEKILPQQVILTYRGETFSLPALTNW